MTNFEVTDSVNYAAECIEAPAWEDMIQFPTLQNLRGIPWAGYTILVPRDYAGARLVVFPAESQLSETVAHDLNLHAKAELNADTTLSGYLACNRRIKAIRLRGVPSNALALPAEYFGSPAVGEVFDTVDGVPVSRKYVVPQKASNGTSGKRVERLWRRVEDKMLPMHYDTGQYWRESDKFADDDMLVVTQKLHGTSVRVANTIVKRKLSWLERLLQRIGVRVQDTEFDVIGGSRKVIKDPTDPNQQHWYGSQDGEFNGDIWTHAAQRFGSVIPKNVILYGELVGWLPDTSTPIQSGYTYRIPVGVYEFFVYRVAVVTEDGGLYDLSWDGVREFCAARGLNHVPELWRGRKSEFDPTHWTDQRFAEAASAARLTGVELFRDIPLPLADESPVDEGIIALREGVVPFALKVKSPVFLHHESKVLDLEDPMLD